MNKREADRHVWSWLLGEINGTPVTEVFGHPGVLYTGAELDKLAQSMENVATQIARKLGRLDATIDRRNPRPYDVEDTEDV